MPQFRPNQTHVTTEPVIQVDAGLVPGTYRFQLIVVDDAGNRSAPAVQTVQITGLVRPTGGNER
jgi:hypothetical protein